MSGFRGSYASSAGSELSRRSFVPMPRPPTYRSTTSEGSCSRLTPPVERSTRRTIGMTSAYHPSAAGTTRGSDRRTEPTRDARDDRRQEGVGHDAPKAGPCERGDDGLVPGRGSRIADEAGNAPGRQRARDLRHRTPRPHGAEQQRVDDGAETALEKR